MISFLFQNSLLLVIIYLKAKVKQLTNYGDKMKKPVKIISLIFLVSLILIPYLTSACDDIWIPSDLYGESFEEMLYDYMEQKHIDSLAFSVLNGSEIFYAKGFGTENETDIAYWMASACKMFTGVAILQLHEQGLLGLDDDISDYLPYELRNPHYPSVPITIKHLLSHRSGAISYECMDTYFPFLGNGTYTFPQITYEFFHENGSIYSENNWYDWEPGTRDAYSDPGFDILTTIICNITGIKYFDYIEDNILTPLGMSKTKYSFEDYFPDELALGYKWNGSSGVNEIVSYFNSSINPGGGAYFSTVEDMSKFMLVHLNQGEYNGIQILNATSVELMHKEISNSGWGLGWRTDVQFNEKFYKGHGGGPWNGFFARMYIRKSLGVAFLINQQIGADDLYGDIFDLAHKLLQEKTCETNLYFLPIVSLLSVATSIRRKIKRKD